MIQHFALFKSFLKFFIVNVFYGYILMNDAVVTVKRIIERYTQKYIRLRHFCGDSCGIFCIFTHKENAKYCRCCHINHRNSISDMNNHFYVLIIFYGKNIVISCHIFETYSELFNNIVDGSWFCYEIDPLMLLSS